MQLGDFDVNCKFQSTLPVWGGTCYRCLAEEFIEFQSTLPVWGGTYVSSTATA